MASFTKLNLDKTFYLSSDRAQVELKPVAVGEAPIALFYTWNVGSITINEYGSLQLLNVVSQVNHNPNSVYVIKVQDIPSKDNMDTLPSSGEVLFVGLLDNKAFNTPPAINVSPQTISQIRISINDNINFDSGVYLSNEFVICLRLMENEPKTITYGGVDSLNKNYSF